MKVVVAVDKFKGSLTASEVAAHVARGLRDVRPDLEVVELPIADGGEGTLDAAVAAGFELVRVPVTGPSGEPLSSGFALRGSTAVVELAAASGLGVLPDDRLQPLTATSRGTGELILAALNHGCTTVILGVGGSACTDGGAGLAQALGVSMRDQDGRELGPGGASLHRAATVDVAGLDPRLAATTFVLAGDVDNPLLGPSGAAAVYGPQKGATIADVALLEGGLSRWVDLLSDAYGPRAREVADSAGAGAAGGVGFAALLILGGRFRPGVEVVLELTDFVRHLRGAALVITGEGSLDGQSLHGKAPLGVAAAAGRSGVPTVAVSGMVAVSHKVLSSVGIRQAYGLTDLEPDVDRCMREAAVLVEEVARRVARDWLTGDRCRT